MSTRCFDKIILNELTLDAHLGWLAEERASVQKISLTVSLEVDVSIAAKTKDLGDTVCYATLAEKYQEFVLSKHWSLVEELAEEICRFTLDNCQNVFGIQVLLKKFVVPKTSWVGVEVKRTRQ